MNERNANIADVTIHIHEVIDTDRRTRLQYSLLALDGVHNVSDPNDKAHLVVVRFNPEKLVSRDILDAVLGTGLKAEMIGL